MCVQGRSAVDGGSVVTLALACATATATIAANSERRPSWRLRLDTNKVLQGFVHMRRFTRELTVRHQRLICCIYIQMLLARKSRTRTSVLGFELVQMKIIQGVYRRRLDRLLGHTTRLSIVCCSSYTSVIQSLDLKLRSR